MTATTARSRSNLNARRRQGADGSASTAPLVVFGWDGDDTITGGAGDDIVFGDRGRVDYIKTVKTDTDNDEHAATVLVDQIITRLGHSVPQNPVNPTVTGPTLMTLTDSTGQLSAADRTVASSA